MDWILIIKPVTRLAMFKLSDAELLEYIAKRKAEKEAAAKASTRSSNADTEDIINSIENGTVEDNVFDEYGEVKVKSKAERRFDALKHDNNIITSFLGRTSINSDSNEEEIVPDHQKKEIGVAFEVTKALLLLGFNNWSSLETGTSISN